MCISFKQNMSNRVKAATKGTENAEMLLEHLSKSPIGPGRGIRFPPHHVISFEGEGLKVDVWGLKDRHHRNAIVTIVMRQARPFNHLLGSINEDVWVCHTIHDDSHSHAANGRFFHDDINHIIPACKLIVDPQAVNAGILHEVKLLADDVTIVQVIDSQVAFIVGIALTEMVIAIVKAEEPWHVMSHILRLHSTRRRRASCCRTWLIDSPLYGSLWDFPVSIPGISEGI